MAVSQWAGPMLRVRWTQGLLAWWYGAPMLRRYKPLLRAEFAAGDLIDESRFLARAGYQLAALSLCRTAIESRIRRAVMVSPVWRKMRREKRATFVSHLMADNGFWPREKQRRFDNLYAKLSGAIHGAAIDAFHAWNLIESSGRLMVELDALVLECLHTGGQPCKA